APARLAAQLSANPSQYITAGRAVAERQQLSAQEYAAMSAADFDRLGRQYFQSNGDRFYLSLNTNPVEIAGLITALAGT
ncbi:hypothetical protein OFC57_41945, partial [Escherichia coli]|nr:hypothetical protein [Escherichia coli]